MPPAPRIPRPPAPRLAPGIAALAAALAWAPPAVADPALAATPGADADAAARALVRAGLENASAAAGEPLRVAYENRSLRHSAGALGAARRAAGAPILAFERRLGLVAAAIATSGPDSLPRFHVRYPSDPGFPAPPAGPLRSATFRRADLDLGALVDYRVGEIFDPFQVRVELEPRLLLNPWPGASARAGVVLPLQNDFPPSDVAPDLDRVRPGRTSLDQFLWVPRAALLSASAGYFGDDRWGVSAGAARP
jgi:hypothetical protein